MLCAQEATYSDVKVDVKCDDGREIPRPAKNVSSQPTRPLLTDEDADIVLRYPLAPLRRIACISAKLCHTLRMLCYGLSCIVGDTTRLDVHIIDIWLIPLRLQVHLQPARKGC